MIIADLKDSERIESLHPCFKKVFDYIKNNDFLAMPLGRIDIDGELAFINNADAKGETRDSKLEGHKDYLDIHIPLLVNETIGWLSVNDAKNCIQEYDTVKDRSFYSDAPSTFVDVQVGQFCIVYPEDLHSPNICETNVRKLVVKIKI